MSIWSPTSPLNAFRADCLKGKGTLWPNHEGHAYQRAVGRRAGEPTILV